MNEREIYVDALEKTSAAERAAFLDDACRGDETLRRRLEALFREQSELGSFLESPPKALAPGAGPTVTHEPAEGLWYEPPEGPGVVIGPYKLLELIGEGGMGVVYMAEQAHPVRRRVALKVIKPGMDTRQVVARFEAERQALAMMDHPNIAKVHDAGATESGRPYFVMELVKGIPITEYCDKARLSIAERLGLFVLVCRAVQHAHQKGIIHRDLKPTNVLVTVIDGAAVPKVIDFGVAKATGASLTDRSLFTGFAQMIGTPLYMSPEQAELSGVDIDTRSDVYALGVLLYELLTGTTPIDGEMLRKVAFDEVRRIIREQETPPPSTRLVALGATLETVSANRHADARSLGRSVHGELDWIVMKALEKDRRRRYETANDFAADVTRYLTDQPVEACPPSASYRFGKFARRNRAVLTTTALIAVALVAGTAVSVWQAVRAVKAERTTAAALAEAQLQRLQARQAERTTAVALAEAQLQRRQARQAVDEMYTQVAEKWLAEQSALTTLQREFLEKALAFYNQFAAVAGEDPQVRHEVIRALYRVGVIRESLGRNTEAEAAFREVVGLATDLVRQVPDRPEYRLALAEGRIHLVWLLRTVGKPFEGDARIVADPEPDPEKPATRKSQAHRTTEAEREIRQAERELADLRTAVPADAASRRRLAEAHNLLCRELTRAHQLPEAEAAVRAAFDLWGSLVTDFPADIENRYGLARTFASQGMQLMWEGNKHGWGNVEKAEVALRQADVLLSKLQAERPADPRFRSALAAALGNQGVVMSWRRRFAEAERALRRSVALDEDLVADFPDVPIYQDNLGKSLNNLAAAVKDQGRGSEADGYFRKAIAIRERLAERHPDVPAFGAELLKVVCNLSGNFHARGEFEEARLCLEPAVLRARPLVEAQPGRRGPLISSYIGALEVLTLILVELGDDDAAGRTAEEWARTFLGRYEGDELGLQLVDHCFMRLRIAVPLSAQLAARLAGGGEANPRGQTNVKFQFLQARALIQEARRRGLTDLPALSLKNLPNLVMLADYLTTAPEEHRNPELALQAARRAVALKSKDSGDAELAWHALGAAQYRAGDFKGCIETLEGHTHAPRDGSFVLAMAYWQSGMKDQARACFARADAWRRDHEKTWTGEYPKPNMLRLLRTEAEALLGVKSPAAPKELIYAPGKVMDHMVEGGSASDPDDSRKDFRFSKGRIRVNPDGVWVMTIDGDRNEYHFRATHRDGDSIKLTCITKNHTPILITKDRILIRLFVDDFVDEFVYRERPGYEGSWVDPQ